MAERSEASGESQIVLRNGTAAEVAELYAQIPEFGQQELAPHDIEHRLAQPGALLLVATIGGHPVGFKAGYDRYGDGSFYSWLGGVLLGARSSGVATALLLEQERQIAAAGYDRIYVKSRNRLVPMLKLLLDNGYSVVGVTLPDDLPLADGRLLFAKILRG